MIPPFVINIGIKIAVDLIVKYIDSSSSKQDDKVLSIVQKGASYLAKKHNNNMTQEQANKINDDIKMLPVQKSRLDI